MAIKDLAARQRPMTVDEVLEGLDEAEFEILGKALRTKQPNNYRYVWSANDIAKNLLEDGYVLTRHEVEEWRRVNVGV